VNIAIIIDPWEKKQLLNRVLFFLDHLYMTIQQIKKFIDSKDNIDIVVVASYDNIPVQKTCLKWIPKKAKKIFFTDEESLRKLLSENKVDNIYINGGAWDICVKDRPLGYINLKKIIDDMQLDTNILVKDNCVVMSNSHNLMPATFVPEDNLDWVETSEQGVYKYTP